MSTKNAIIKAKVENEIVELMVKSNVANIFLDDGTTTLASKLAEIITSLNEKAKTTEVTKAISDAIDRLIGGAPATYDTLKEISDYIAEHEEVVTALNSAIGNKVDKVEGMGLSAENFTTELKTKLEEIDTTKIHDHANKGVLNDITAEKVAGWENAARASHSHANATVLNGVTAEKVTEWDGKSKLYIQSAVPADFKAGELLIQITE